MSTSVFTNGMAHRGSPPRADVGGLYRRPAGPLKHAGDRGSRPGARRPGGLVKPFTSISHTMARPWAVGNFGSDRLARWRRHDRRRRRRGAGLVGPGARPRGRSDLLRLAVRALAGAR